jgi:hypothetical protein
VGDVVVMRAEQTQVGQAGAAVGGPKSQVVDYRSGQAGCFLIRCLLFWQARVPGD